MLCTLWIQKVSRHLHAACRQAWDSTVRGFPLPLQEISLALNQRLLQLHIPVLLLHEFLHCLLSLLESGGQILDVQRTLEGPRFSLLLNSIVLLCSSYSPAKFPKNTRVTLRADAACCSECSLIFSQWSKRATMSALKWLAVCSEEAACKRWASLAADSKNIDIIHSHTSSNRLLS